MILMILMTLMILMILMALYNLGHVRRVLNDLDDLAGSGKGYHVSVDVCMFLPHVSVSMMPMPVTSHVAYSLVSQ